MSIWCRFGWHEWAPWQVTGEGEIVSYGFLGRQEPMRVGLYTEQRRACVQCAKLEMTTTKSELR